MSNPEIPIVHIEEASKSYANGASIRALDGLSCTIARGEFVAIQGRSGSGKTTLLNLIGTLDQPTSGQVIVSGVDVTRLNGDALADFRRAHIGFVFQLFNLVPTLNALENVMLPLLPYQRRLRFNLQARARELLSDVGLASRLRHLPGQLSGGEQQRVAVARALINIPELILADEPTGNLDSHSGAETLRLLQRLNREQGITIVMVTHDVAIAGAADRTIRLQDGRLAQQEEAKTC